ncbi:hypothetical protein [Fodinicola feengrottensis]|uniref:hypothetical protein n=1 Tax=Fodinicola feengrottensis TaxID=435914 RepID=UPI0013D54AD8|nr:hypothetical protein [Fodinicola feengrottensis]
MLSAGIADLPWAGALDAPIEAGNCWQMGDVFGDSCMVVAEFVRNGQRHAISGHLGLDGLNGLAEEINLLDKTDGLARGTRRPR